MHSVSKNCIVVVDGYKFAKDFSDSIKARGVEAIHVSSTLKPISVMETSTTYNPNDFLASFCFNEQPDGIKTLVEKLKAYPIIAVIAATEPGVLLADQLAKQLNCPRQNGIQNSQARRNKYLMLEAVKQHHVMTPKYFASDDIEKIKNWIKIEQPYPVVLKPLLEACTHGVRVVNNDLECEQAFLNINQLGSIFGENEPQPVLAEEFLNGSEYVVNTLSCHGKHFIVDVWRYQKTYTKNGYSLYDKTILQSADFEAYENLKTYMFSVLDALNIRFGVSHGEIMLTSNGPRLIEVGARPSGMSDKKLWQRCLGYNQIDLCVASYLDDTSDFSFLNDYNLKENAMVMTLENEMPGKLIRQPDVDVIKQVPSYYKHVLYYQLGQLVPMTTTLLDCPGRIFFIHENKDVILNDYAFLKKYFKENYVIEPLE